MRGRNGVLCKGQEEKGNGRSDKLVGSNEKHTIRPCHNDMSVGEAVTDVRSGYKRLLVLATATAGSCAALDFFFQTRKSTTAVFARSLLYSSEKYVFRSTLTFRVCFACWHCETGLL